MSEKIKKSNNNRINSKSIKSNTGYKNIRFIKSTGRFESYLMYRYKANFNKRPIKYSIGMFDTLKEAVNARENFITSLY